jgi:sugar phosphate isomerase/epimerase
MKVGLDLFSIRELEQTPAEKIDFAKARGFEGVQGSFGNLADPEALPAIREIKEYAESQDMYLEVNCSLVNPFLKNINRDEHKNTIISQIRNGADLGWHDFYTSVGGPAARAVPMDWEQQLQGIIEFMKELKPVLADCGSRINIEPKGCVSTFEAVRLVEAVGPDVMGICLDIANTLCFAENPVEAAKRCAPYTHMTHSKDAIVYFCEAGLRRQVKPAGEGVVDWEQIIPILGEYSPYLNLSIEDHKWLYDMECFDPEWPGHATGLTSSELGSVFGLAHKVEQKIGLGEIPDPDTYEEIPYTEQLEVRLKTAAATLKKHAAAFAEPAGV